jgi:hypothetical protein
VGTLVTACRSSASAARQPPRIRSGGRHGCRISSVGGTPAGVTCRTAPGRLVDVLGLVFVPLGITVMPLLDVLDVLRHRASRRHESAAETLWAAAKRIAAGETADPTAVEAALAETGTSLDGFNELVELARTRRRLFAKLDQATPARVKLDKLNASTAAEREAFEDTRRRWLERAAVLGDEISALERIVQAGNEARDALCQPENLPATVAEKVEAAIESHGAALVQLDALQRELNRQREIRDRRTWMAAQKRESGKCHPLDIDDDERLAKRAVNQIAELEPQLREAQAAVHAAETHIASCRAAALKA